MSTRAPRFEVVRTDAEQPWHARFIARNGRVVWTTENYTRRGAAIGAIEAITQANVYYVQGNLFLTVRLGVLEVRHVDERTTP